MEIRVSRSAPRVLSALLGMLWLASAASAQREYRRFLQDQNLNNLVHPEGYQTGPPDTLGRVRTVGNGAQAMVLIAGMGFGDDIFDIFMEQHKQQFTMYAVTLAGFGGTPAPPMPPAGTSYGEQIWTRGAQRAVEALIKEKQLHRPILVGHWIIGTQVALGLALEKPEMVRAVVLISGVTKMPTRSPPATLKDRVAEVDNVWAPRWFKTVTQDTWDDNNFLPRDYAIHPVRALQLWRQAAQPTLPTNVHYGLESRAQDVTLEIPKLKVPVLALIPGFDEEFFAGPHNSEYMRWFCHQSWEGLEGKSEFLEMKTIAGSRVFMMDDKPEEFEKALADFLGKL